MPNSSSRPSAASPASSVLSATPMTSTSAEPEPSGSSPTPNTPSTCSPAATVQPPPPWDDQPLRTPHPSGPHGTGGVSIEKLGAATTQLLTEWLARHCGAGGKITSAPSGPRRSRLRWTGTTHPKPCANKSSCATATASSPAAAATPAAATSTTSPPTSPWTKAAHQARPTRKPGTPLPQPPQDQDLHRLGLQTARPRRQPGCLRLDRPHRPPVRGQPGLPAPSTTKSLTPRHPGPPQPGPSARRPVGWFRQAQLVRPSPGSPFDPGLTPPDHGGTAQPLVSRTLPHRRGLD